MTEGELTDFAESTVLVAEGSCAPSQIGPEIARLFEGLRAGHPGAELVDAPRVYYVHWSPDACRIQAAAPVDPASPEALSPSARRFPAGTAFFTTFTGPYDGLAAAWADLWSQAERLALTSGGAPWDRYVVGPDVEPDPERWVTELYIPVQITRLA